MNNTWSKKIAISAVALATLAITPITFAQSMPATTAATTTATTATVKGLWSLKVTAVNGTTLTAVNGAGTSYTVDASNSKFIRRYRGASTLSEVSVGDMIWVRGTHVKGSTDLTATLVHNMSVQERGVVSGTVESVSSTGFVLSNYGATTYTVNVSSTTQYRNSTKDQFAALSDLMVGDRVRVDGVRDNVTMIDNADAMRLLSRPVTTAAPMAPVVTPAATQATSS